jgi:hypothetical protein
MFSRFGPLSTGSLPKCKISISTGSQWKTVWVKTPGLLFSVFRYTQDHIYSSLSLISFSYFLFISLFIFHYFSISISLCLCLSLYPALFSLSLACLYLCLSPRLYDGLSLSFYIFLSFSPPLPLYVLTYLSFILILSLTLPLSPRLSLCVSVSHSLPVAF